MVRPTTNILRLQPCSNLRRRQHCNGSTDYQLPLEKTYKDQARVWGNNCSNAIGSGKCVPKKGEGPAAIPGTSNHGFGLAVDLANNGGTKLSTSMPEYDWVAENGPGFGFKRIASEAWHWEYQTT